MFSTCTRNYRFAIGIWRWWCWSETFLLQANWRARRLTPVVERVRGAQYIQWPNLQHNININELAVSLDIKMNLNKAKSFLHGFHLFAVVSARNFVSISIASNPTARPNNLIKTEQRTYLKFMSDTCKFEILYFFIFHTYSSHPLPLPLFNFSISYG